MLCLSSHHVRFDPFLPSRCVADEKQLDEIYIVMSLCDQLLAPRLLHLARPCSHGQIVWRTLPRVTILRKEIVEKIPG